MSKKNLEVGVKEWPSSPDGFRTVTKYQPWFRIGHQTFHLAFEDDYEDAVAMARILEKSLKKL